VKASKGTEDILLAHAALVALTPLIPLPFVDDVAKNRLQRRMVHALADRRGVVVAARSVETIADDESAVLAGIGRSLALVPIRFVLRRLLLVLRGKSIVDLASRTYHRGFLVDAAFAYRLCEPAGPATARELRAAIDEVLATVPIASSPVTHAIREGLARSGKALLDVYGRLRGDEPRGVDAALDAATASLAGDAVDPLRRAVDEVPPAHFEALEGALLAALGRRGIVPR
jgi:uncharacterized protein (DUF697 family)